MAAAISPACVSRAKWPVSKKRTTAPGMSRLNASAPDGRKNGSFLPHAASSGGRCVRKYSWNVGYSATLLAYFWVKSGWSGDGVAKVRIVGSGGLERHVDDVLTDGVL